MPRRTRRCGRRPGHRGGSLGQKPPRVSQFDRWTRSTGGATGCCPRPRSTHRGGRALGCSPPVPDRLMAPWPVQPLPGRSVPPTSGRASRRRCRGRDVDRCSSHDTAAGESVSSPPRFSHWVHVLPVQIRCRGEPSDHVANTSDDDGAGVARNRRANFNVPSQALPSRARGCRFHHLGRARWCPPRTRRCGRRPDGRRGQIRVPLRPASRARSHRQPLVGAAHLSVPRTNRSSVVGPAGPPPAPTSPYRQ